MIPSTERILVRQDMYFGGLEIHLANKEPDGSLAIANSVTFTQINPQDMTVRESKPMCVIERSTAQQLMDQLWQNGIRPSDIGTPGHLEATKKHLEDMRSIAFNRLGVDKP